MTVPATPRTENARRRRGYPILVKIIDVEDVPAEISAAHPGGGSYVGLWVLARAGGEPRAFLKLPFTGDRITAAELHGYLSGPAFTPRATARAPLADPALISVVVPTMFSRERELRNCLDSLMALDYPRYEVIVVDNRPDDGPSTAAWSERYPSVRLVRERRPGLAAARNCGLHAAAGGIVAITDDDVVVDAGWLTAFARRFAAHPDEVAVGGFMMPEELETEAQVILEEYYGNALMRLLQPASHKLERPRRGNPFRKATMVERSDDGEVLQRFSLYSPGKLGPGQSRAFRTDVLRAVGGFDERLGAVNGEDILLWFRLAWRGYSIGWEPAALVSHVHRRDDAGLRYQIEDYGAGFTATLTALVLEDPRHLAAILATAPRALYVMGRWFSERLRTKNGGDDGAPPDAAIAELARLELHGMLRGPVAYIRSARRWRASSAPGTSTPQA
jgi:GT2 family glycosyltransferase